MTNRCLNTFVFVVLLGLLSNLFGQTQRTSPPAIAKPKPTAPAIRELTVDEVLGWRSAIVDLLGNDLATATNRYGPPDEINDFPAKEGAPTHIEYEPSQKTDNRYLSLWAINRKVSNVTIFPASYERLDVQRVLLRGWEFCFSTGLTAISKSGRTAGDFNATLRTGAAELNFSIEGTSILSTRLGHITLYNRAGPTTPCTPQEVNRNKRPIYE